MKIYSFRSNFNPQRKRIHANEYAGKQNRTIESLPVDETQKILRKYGKIK